MKVFLIGLFMLFTCSQAKAELEIYNYVNLDELSNLSYNNGVMTVTLKGVGGDNDGNEPDNVIVNARVDGDNLSMTTSNFKRVHMYRFKRELLKQILDLYENLNGVE